MTLTKLGRVGPLLRDAPKSLSVTASEGAALATRALASFPFSRPDAVGQSPSTAVRAALKRIIEYLKQFGLMRNVIVNYGVHETGTKHEPSVASSRSVGMRPSTWSTPSGKSSCSCCVLSCSTCSTCARLTCAQVVSVDDARMKLLHGFRQNESHIEISISKCKKPILKCLLAAQTLLTSFF